MRGEYYVYLMTNYTKSVLYTGVTGNLSRRVGQHKSERLAGYTSKYHAHYLVYYELYTDVHVALNCEKQIKGWRREKKNALVHSVNPEWKELKVQGLDPVP